MKDIVISVLAISLPLLIAYITYKLTSFIVQCATTLLHRGARKGIKDIPNEYCVITVCASGPDANKDKVLGISASIYGKSTNKVDVFSGFTEDFLHSEDNTLNLKASVDPSTVYSEDRLIKFLASHVGDLPVVMFNQGFQYTLLKTLIKKHSVRDITSNIFLIDALQTFDVNLGLFHYFRKAKVPYSKPKKIHQFSNLVDKAYVRLTLSQI